MALVSDNKPDKFIVEIVRLVGEQVGISGTSWVMASDNKPDKFIVEKVGISDTRLYYVDID